MAMKQRMIIDANVIAAPSSPLLEQNAERGGATRLKTDSRIWRLVIPIRAASDISASRGCTCRMNDHNRFAEPEGNGMGQFTGMIHSLEATFARPNILALLGLVATVLVRDCLVGHAV
jgi:hypothetical protein